MIKPSDYNYFNELHCSMVNLDSLRPNYLNSGIQSTVEIENRNGEKIFTVEKFFKLKNNSPSNPFHLNNSNSKPQDDVRLISNQINIPCDEMRKINSKSCQNINEIIAHGNPIGVINGNGVNTNNKATANSILARIRSSRNQFHLKNVVEWDFKDDSNVKNKPFVGEKTPNQIMHFTNNKLHLNNSADKRLLVNSETFTKRNPYLISPLDDQRLTNGYLEIKKDADESLINPDFNESRPTKISSKETRREMKSDKIVDTKDLANFVQQFPTEKFDLDDGQHEFTCSLKIPSIKLNANIKSEKEVLGVANISIDNRKFNKSRKNERKNDTCADDICDMLNTLLKDLKANKLDNSSLVKGSSHSTDLDYCETESASSKSDMLQLFQDLPKTYTKLCNKVLEDVKHDDSKSSKFLNKKKSNYLNLMEHCKLAGDTVTKLSSNSHKVYQRRNYANNMDSIDNFRMCTRIFSLDPFDELIKSYLSTTDRRLRSISKKINCTIKILGPYNFIYNQMVPNNRWKILYYCHLVSDSKEKCAKCLKCLQDSFPSMQLREINVTHSVYKN